MVNQYTCTICASEYVLSGWNCLTVFNFGFFISLNTNVTTFFNNYQGFLQALGEQVNANNFNWITVTTVTSGVSSSSSEGRLLQSGNSNVNVSGNISTAAQSNTNGAQTQYNQLQSLLNGNIVGMPINIYTIFVNNG